jgi:hypothetical protein
MAPGMTAKNLAVPSGGPDPVDENRPFRRYFSACPKSPAEAAER